MDVLVYLNFAHQQILFRDKMHFLNYQKKQRNKIPIHYFGRYQIFLWPYFLDITVRLYVSKGKKYFHFYYH
ncbi:hypothetical protein COK72_09275, partial [Bacillus thuringiensis]